MRNKNEEEDNSDNNDNKEMVKKEEVLSYEEQTRVTYLKTISSRSPKVEIEVRTIVKAGDEKIAVERIKEVLGQLITQEDELLQ